MTDTDICGNECADGSKCQRQPGWGTDSDIGPCADHLEEDAGPGRPTKFDEERREAILDAARQGATMEGCARAAGIHHSTLYDWMDRYPEFSEALNRARADGEQELLEEVVKRDPKFILERSFGYIKTEKREVDADVSLDGADLLADFNQDDART